MALNIEDPETGRLARALADATGESVEAAVKTAIEQRLKRESSASDPALFDDLLKISKGAAALGWRSPDKSSVELLDDLYGENGLPARCAGQSGIGGYRPESPDCSAARTVPKQWL